VELLPGASSALYGANDLIYFIYDQSKPFTSQITAYAKFGQTSQKLLGTNHYVDYGISACVWSKTCRKLTLPICAVQIGMLQTTMTNERWVETKSCEL
jgi:hypothetical protein